MRDFNTLTLLMLKHDARIGRFHPLGVTALPPLWMRDPFRRLIVNFVHFMAKHYRHQDTEAQKGLLTNGVPSCRCAFVAILSGLSGLGLFNREP